MVVAFQVIFWREKGWLRRYSARRLRPALSWAGTDEGFDGSGGVGVERAEILAVPFFAVGEELVPAVVDELP